jgi:hypothetical protein
MIRISFLPALDRAVGFFDFCLFLAWLALSPQAVFTASEVIGQLDRDRENGLRVARFNESFRRNRLVFLISYPPKASFSQAGAGLDRFC